MKAYDIMSAITSVLAETVKDFSATAYFASLSSMYASARQSQTNPEALAYCYSAIVSMLDLPII